MLSEKSQEDTIEGALLTDWIKITAVNFPLYAIMASESR